MRFVFLLVAALISYLATIHLPWVATVPILVFVIAFCLLSQAVPKNVEQILAAADSGIHLAASKTPLFSMVGVVIGVCVGIFMLHPSWRDLIVRLLTP